MEQKQKVTVNALTTEKETIYDFLKNAPAAIAVIQSSDLVFHYANEPYLKLIGRTNDIVGLSLLEVLPEIEESLLNIIKEVSLEGKRFAANEMPVLLDWNSNGKPFNKYLNFVYEPILENGNPNGLMAYIYDVTDQVRSRKIVEDQNKVLETIGSGSSLSEALDSLVKSIQIHSKYETLGSVLLLSEDGQRLLYGSAPSLPADYNKAIHGITIGPSVGSCGAAAYNKTTIFVTDIATDPLWKDFKDLALSHGLKSCWSTPILSGEKVLGTFALYSTAPHYPSEEDQRILQFATRTASLIIERFRSGEELRKSEEKFRALITATSEIIYKMSSDWKIMYNLDGQGLLSNTGQYFSEWIYKYIPQGNQKHVKDSIEESILQKKVFQLEHQVIQSNGKIGWVSSRAVPILNENKDIIEWFGAATDITQRKLAEEALADKNLELTKINNDLDNFIYTASHDLKSPISNLEGLFNTLLEEVDGNDNINMITEMINQSFQRFKNTIKDLTEISKVQKEESNDLDELNLAELIYEINIGLIDHKLLKQPKFTTDLQVSTLKFSRKNLRSILYNLLSNAIKYSSPDRHPSIHLSTYSENEYVVIRVADNGLGIPNFNKSKMFQMFKRFHNHVEGSGIGLYIVKRIVDNAGGSIVVESEEGKGSTFIIYLLAS